MALHRQGDADEATRTLDQANAVLKQHMPGLDAGIWWVDWLAAHILYREAEALICAKKVEPRK
jgi:hypothetical protein